MLLWGFRREGTEYILTNNNRPVKELPAADRPYEKFARFGAQALSDAELLAIILRSGTKGISSLQLAHKVLENGKWEEGLNGLFHLDTRELEKIPGIGHVKAIQLKCVCEISRRISRNAARLNLCFDSPASIATYYMETLRHEEQEQVYCMMLDSKNSLLGDLCVTKGTVNYSVLSPREIFLAALSYRAVSIVLIHNHPSGDPSPSADDIRTTQEIYDAGRLLGIALLDHIVIGNNCYVSIVSERKLIKE